VNVDVYPAAHYEMGKQPRPARAVRRGGAGRPSRGLASISRGTRTAGS